MLGCGAYSAAGASVLRPGSGGGVSSRRGEEVGLTPIRAGTEGRKKGLSVAGHARAAWQQPLSRRRVRVRDLRGQAGVLPRDFGRVRPRRACSRGQFSRSGVG
ncbi:uncharacterized protein M6B38_315600 [Iris pallida]|uniref:Uncharacterized protein n=1 Tax=Iris pallida TaxID=29817 RepID=A0AAX6HF54_IRIPA|nr:uncharacterized protein M6B38_376660 [Iris pallida]KAJ6839669.1 uncharacterized protein M6B38_315600 [Iris pallida]